MNQLGLKPTDDGTPLGKETGQRMTHIILSGGLFDAATDDLLTSGFELDWESHYHSNPRETSNIKVKYTCACGDNIWAKPGIQARCQTCEQPFEEQSR